MVEDRAGSVGGGSFKPRKASSVGVSSETPAPGCWEKLYSVSVAFSWQYCFHTLCVFSLDAVSRQKKIKRHSKETSKFKQKPHVLIEEKSPVGSLLLGKCISGMLSHWWWNG